MQDLVQNVAQHQFYYRKDESFKSYENVNVSRYAINKPSTLTTENKIQLRKLYKIWVDCAATSIFFQELLQASSKINRLPEFLFRSQCYSMYGMQ